MASLELVLDKDHKDLSLVMVDRHYYSAFLLPILYTRLVLLILGGRTFDYYNPSFKLHIHSSKMLS
jgi:hypothetical protein